MKVKFEGRTSSSMKTIRDFVKNDYVKRTFEVDEHNRTEVVRLFMDALKPIALRDSKKATRVRKFLTRFYLSNAEIHAILFRLGFRYSTLAEKKYYHSALTGGSYHLRNIKINGYHQRSFKEKMRLVGSDKP